MYLHPERLGTVRVDPLTLQTDDADIFAGGDAVTGPKTVIEAIAAGKHVYTENPFAVTRAEGQRVVAAARKKGVRAGSAPDTFFGAGIQTARAAIGLPPLVVSVELGDAAFDGSGAVLAGTALARINRAFGAAPDVFPDTAIDLVLSVLALRHRNLIRR